MHIWYLHIDEGQILTHNIVEGLILTLNDVEGNIGTVNTTIRYPAQHGEKRISDTRILTDTLSGI